MAELTEEQKRQRDQMITEIRNQYEGPRQDVYREIDDYYDQQAQLEQLDASESREIGTVYDGFDPPYQCKVCHSTKVVGFQAGRDDRDTVMTCQDCGYSEVIA